MVHRGKIGPFQRLFPAERIPVVLEAMLRCCDVLKKTSERESENALTQRLHGKLICIYPFRDGPLDIVLQPQLVQEQHKGGMPVGQPDLKVCCGYGAQVYFVIEAKRLYVLLSNGKRDSGVSKYVDEGMMRFVTGLYAPRMESSAMLGYVLDAGVARARRTIAKAVTTKARTLKLRPNGKMQQSGILPGKRVDETLHNFDGRRFILYHLLVAV